jgi:hypothetical protein
MRNSNSYGEDSNVTCLKRLGGFSFGAFFFLFSIGVEAQSADWWSTLVNWDGVTHWSKYITFSPAYMGVNALPVPSVGNGSIDSVNSFALTGGFHFSRGDNSQNPILYGNYCVMKNRLSVDVNWIPVEWFQMSHAMKEKRKVYWEDYYAKSAPGDINFNINFQLLNNWRKKIHIAFRAGYRYPTSFGVASARMTNAPGYDFDLSFGKKFGMASNWKVIGMIGFYVWQTNNDRPRLYQNDAVSGGLGVQFDNKQYRIQSYFAGYSGYLDNGDQPLVYRFNFERRLNRVSVLARFQQGLHDLDYSSFETGLKVNLPGKKSGQSQGLGKF